MPRRTKRQEAGLPELRHLGSDESRSLIIQIRKAVEPILANNLLHHFTDHTVSHSDCLCHLIDKLIADLQDTDRPLSDDELVVLYSACYLHDVGMQYENAGQTRVVQQLNLSPTWEQISHEERQHLLRRHHHDISAELVEESVRTGAMPLGLQLTDAHHPAQIARLCAAHCVMPNTQRYAELTSQVPGMRMPLLTGLLRLADILDESRHRACREKAMTLRLDLESQTHWWRHYFTKDVEIDSEDKRITIWFEFPRELVDEYQRVVPHLQLPWIEHELDYHREAFNQAGIGWSLQTKTETGPYSKIEAMPDSVMTEMLKQLRQRRLQEEQRSRDVALRAFKEARPHIERRHAALRERKPTMPVDEYISELASLATDLWELGGRRSGWMSLSGEFERAYASLSVAKRVEIGTRLLRMLIDDDQPEPARGWAGRFDADVTQMETGEFGKAPGLEAVAEWYLQICDYEEAVAAFGKAISCARDQDAARLAAQLREMHFLQGELEKAIGEFQMVN